MGWGFPAPGGLFAQKQGHRGTLKLDKTLVQVLLARTLRVQTVCMVKARKPSLFPFACRKDGSCSVLRCLSDLPCPAQLSPRGGFLAGSCQELLAGTSRCPSAQLLKAADGDAGCRCARPLALQTWLGRSRASGEQLHLPPKFLIPHVNTHRGTRVVIRSPVGIASPGGERCPRAGAGPRAVPSLHHDSRPPGITSGSATKKHPRVKKQGKDSEAREPLT